MTRTKREAGYTLIEILTVVAILAILMSIVLVGAMKYRKTAYIESTRATLDTISAALEQYKADFGQYPPDGFDPQHPAMRVLYGTNTPQQIRGSACLIFYLATPLVKEVEVGEDIVHKKVGPYMELKMEQISGYGDVTDRIADPTNELLDAWGNPIHYQRVDIDPTTQRPRLFDQSSPAVHTMKNLNAATQHGPDPRNGPGGLISKKEGSYDLWSHGPDVTDTTDDLTNWNN